MSKNLVNKYVWLVETIYKEGEISLEELNKKWLDSGLSEGVDISKRTFHKWKKIIEEMFGILIDCERKGGYHYYISNREELKGSGLRNWLLSTLSVSNILMEHKQLHQRILTEEIPSNREHLAEILDAMNHNSVISITYQSFWKDQANTFEVQPYCVKMFKQRWYLVAYSPGDDSLRIYALDRIIDTDITERSFQMPENFDPASFFNDYYGVIANTDTPLETVQLKVEAGQANYLRSLPLHHSQKEVENSSEYCIFELSLRPEFDFMMELLSMGASVKVLSPIWLRNEMKEQAKRLCKNYKK
ncbi:MAG: WYL domain-containing protein [Bacteroidales bacterium]|nr:WYL domain-containing protein [Bacteroidales bacterium]